MATNDEDKPKRRGKALPCGTVSPGPKYPLKPVVGYNDHCLSKFREPAYTIGIIQKHKASCVGPGPNKYLYNLPGIPGYTIPRSYFKDVQTCSPGPKYTLPPFTSPAYSIVHKPKYICSRASPGPYSAPPIPIGPAFTIVGKGKEGKCEINPPIRNVGPVTLVRECSPAFSIIPRRPLKIKCIGPGPNKYYPQLLKKAPEFTFGMKYSDCTQVARTECDELC